MPINLDPLNKVLLGRLGTNPFGGANWRIVWSEDRLEYMAGEMVRKYGDGKNCYVLEGWTPPSHYGDPDTFEGAKDEDGITPMLGPFPRQGDYEHCKDFEVDGEQITPTEDLAILICKVVEAGKLHTRTARRIAIRDAQEKKRAAAEQRRLDMIDEILGPFGANAVSGNPGKKTLDDVKVSINAEQLPANLPRKHGFSQI